ncbi:MAG: hypothetical protein AAGD25_06540 [Cyanobacteria bacterium P01_F01_bin.150]
MKRRKATFWVEPKGDLWWIPKLRQWSKPNLITIVLVSVILHRKEKPSPTLATCQRVLA